MLLQRCLISAPTSQILSRRTTNQSCKLSQLFHHFSTKSNTVDIPQPIPLAEVSLSSSSSQNWTQQDIAESLKPHHTNQSPVILRGAVSNSRACELWNDLNYLESTVGEDTACEVEIGKSYASDEGIVRPTIAFGSYIDYIRLSQQQQIQTQAQEMKEWVYLAQHEVFSRLQSDFTIPSLCSDDKFGVGNGRLYSTLLWFGPGGCVTPLHYDPMDNLLMQFVGTKRVLLYQPYPTADSTSTDGTDMSTTVMESEEELSTSSKDGTNDNKEQEDWYYPGGGVSSGGKQPNTSAVDVEHPDLVKYPRFAEAPPAFEGMLEPGDVLFIPKKWWHHIRSLDTSMSINTWWR